MHCSSALSKAFSNSHVGKQIANVPRIYASKFINIPMQKCTQYHEFYAIEFGGCGAYYDLCLNDLGHKMEMTTQTVQIF